MRKPLIYKYVYSVALGDDGHAKLAEVCESTRMRAGTIIRAMIEASDARTVARALIASRLAEETTDKSRGGTVSGNRAQAAKKAMAR